MLNVYRWYGVRLQNGELLFKGSYAEVSRFRNACLEFFRELHPDRYRRHFPNSKGRSSHGSRSEPDEFDRWTTMTFEVDVTERPRIRIVHRQTGEGRIVYPT